MLLISFACTTTSQTGDASDFQVRYVGAAIGGDLTATPLPSTWTMLIAGFAGLGFAAYRGTKKTNSTPFATC